MRRDSMGAGALADSRNRNGIGLRVFRIGHGRVTRLAQSLDVINVYTESKSFHRMLNRFQRTRGSKFFRLAVREKWMDFLHEKACVPSAHFVSRYKFKE